MDMFLVEGGVPLRGTVTVGGAKNTALPIMAAALLTRGRTVLHNVPRLVDVQTMIDLLRSLGVQVEWDGDALALDVVDETNCLADYELVRRMRAGVCVLGPLLAKRGRACVSLPGGCNIGDRPIDLHLKGLRALGAEIRIERGYVVAEAARLKGAHIYLGGPYGSTVTGTCNVLSAAVVAEGTTIIEAAACEPEVVDLGNCLNARGAQISGLGTPLLRIDGVENLRGVPHTIIPDRIEAATLMIAAAMTGGEITVQNARPDHLTAVTEALRASGVHVESHRSSHGNREHSASGPDDGEESMIRSRTSELGTQFSALSENPVVSPLRLANSPPISAMTVSAANRPQNIDLVANPYPGIPTDVQAQFMALLTTAAGISVVTDRVFPDRFMHAAELCRMGAKIRREGPTGIISGVERLSGACVMASDLRASAALVLAALAADGPTVIRRIYHLDRGYEALEDKLNSLGAHVRRLADIPRNLPAAFQNDRRRHEMDRHREPARSNNLRRAS